MLVTILPIYFCVKCELLEKVTQTESQVCPTQVGYKLMWLLEPLFILLGISLAVVNKWCLLRRYSKELRQPTWAKPGQDKSTLGALRRLYVDILQDLRLKGAKLRSKYPWWSRKQRLYLDASTVLLGIRLGVCWQLIIFAAIVYQVVQPLMQKAGVKTYRVSLPWSDQVISLSSGYDISTPLVLLGLWISLWSVLMSQWKINTPGIRKHLTQKNTHKK